MQRPIPTMALIHAIGIILFMNLYLISSLAHDCCPSEAKDGTYNPLTGKCYWVSDFHANWTDSKQACHDKGAQLGIADTIEDVDFISSIRSGEIWMGVDDLDAEGNFTYYGAELPRTLWATGQPNGHTYEDGQDCVILDSGKKWQDKRCKDHHYFMCEWPLVLDHSYAPIKFIKSEKQTLCDHRAFDYFYTRSLLHCAGLCHRDRLCVYFGFISETKQCVLYQHHVGVTQTIPSSTRLYMLKLGSLIY